MLLGTSRTLISVVTYTVVIGDKKSFQGFRFFSLLSIKDFVSATPVIVCDLVGIQNNITLSNFTGRVFFGGSVSFQLALLNRCS